MGHKDRLAQKETKIVNKWFDQVIQTYSPDAAIFFKGNRDKFANPVGNTLRSGLESIFHELINEPDYKKISSSLDPIIRIRAVQDFSPSQATDFILSLKKIIRDYFKKDFNNQQTVQELLYFESKIDQVVLIAFDIYMECKQKISDLRTSVERNQIYKAFSRAGLVTEISENGPDLKSF